MEILGGKPEITEMKIGVQRQKRYRMIKLNSAETESLVPGVFNRLSGYRQAGSVLARCRQGTGWCLYDLGKGTSISSSVICK